MNSIQRLLAATLLACLAIPAGQIVANATGIRPLPYLFPLIFLVALEAMTSHGRLRGVGFENPRFWLARLAEWVVLIIFLKFYLYAFSGFERLLLDLPAWRANFFSFFSTPEYLILLLMVAAVWALSGELEGLFAQLNADEQLLLVDVDAGFSAERQALRAQLANLILAGGGLMILLTTILNLAEGGQWAAAGQTSRSVAALVAYFLCGLVLLSLTQFSILRARWLIDRAPIDARIRNRWFGFSFGLIFLLAVLAIALPTGYSVRWLQTLQAGFGYLLVALQFIAYLLLFPFMLLFGWIMSLFKHPVEAPAPPAAVLYPPPEYIPGQPVAWFEWLKTILFWAALIGLVCFAFIYYFREHPEYVNWLQRRRFWGALVRFGREALAWLRRTNRQVAAAFERRRPAGSSAPPLSMAGQFHNPARLTPDEQLRFYYLALARRAAEQGLPRQAAQTPYEYSEMLKTKIIQAPSGRPAPSAGSGQPAVDSPSTPSFAADLADLTDGFSEARYSQHLISADRAGRGRLAWQRLLSILRTRKS